MQLSYRPEIDSLRGIAIILVVLYHLNLEVFGKPFFEFGYLGVDIFFVISGYLIGRIILLGLFNKSFCFKTFYENRARRLLPALIFTIFLSLPLSLIFILPIDLVHFGKSIVNSIFFTSNFFFFFTDVEYSGFHDTLLFPLLHTWSLSVEEQFYLFFPITVFLAYKFFKKFLFFIFILGIIVSLILAEFLGTNISKSLNFFMLPTRVWELLIGTLVAYYEIKNYKSNLLKQFNNVFPLIGILLLIISFYIFNDNTKHPSFISIIPVIGTGLILISKKTENNLIFKILSIRFLISIGLISYSLYLVHFPIFAFYRIYFENIKLLDTFFLIPFIFIISYLSYRYIERPFRDKKKVRLKTFLIAISVSFSFLTMVSIYLIHSNGLSSRLPEIFSNESNVRERDKLRDNYGRCFSRKENFCNFNKFKDRPKAILIGDSIMGSISYNLKERLDEKKINLKTIMLGTCYYLPNYEIAGLNCDKNFQEISKREILEEKNAIVIIGGHLTHYLTNNKQSNEKNSLLDKAIVSSMNELLKSNHKIIIIYPIPALNDHVPQSVFNLLKREILLKLDKKQVEKKLSKNIIFIDYKDYIKKNKRVFEIYDKLNHPNLYKVYPHNLFCDSFLKEKCVGNTEKVFFYSDKYHPSRVSSKMINDLIIKKIDKILKNN